MRGRRICMGRINTIKKKIRNTDIVNYDTSDRKCSLRSDLLSSESLVPKKIILLLKMHSLLVFQDDKNRSSD